MNLFVLYSHTFSPHNNSFVCLISFEITVIELSLCIKNCFCAKFVYTSMRLCGVLHVNNDDQFIYLIQVFALIYFMSKRQLPFLYSNLLYKIGNYFLE